MSGGAFEPYREPEAPRSWPWRGCGCAAVVCVLLAFAGIIGFAWLVTGPVDLLLGWALFARDAGQRVRPNPEAIALGAICLVLVAAGVHWLARWLRREMRPGALAWRLRSSLALTAGIVLAFAAGIGVVGIAHQAAWLATSPEPLLESHPDWGREIAAMSEMRRIAGVQAEFRAKDLDGDGRPDFATLEELAAAHLVDTIVASGTKEGYLFVVGPSVTVPEERWFATAVPRSERAGHRSFFVNHDGKICYTYAPGPLRIDRASCEVPEGMKPLGQ